MQTKGVRKEVKQPNASLNSWGAIFTNNFLEYFMMQQCQKMSLAYDL